MMPPGMDPKKMQQVMKQMGIQSKDIDAKQVVIETEDGNYVIKNPQVVEISMQGQKSFQISGEVTQETSLSKEDIEMVVSQANCSEQEAEDALKKCNGDIAEAILSLKGNE